ncbi:exonuclease SbcCD subunit D [Synechococcus sp. BA-124 BA4]|uniref:exonuclease SbcCD subunit D n=1 Tax=unclassified Synechococcus TaxID=2626047 RepID=UPI0018CFCE79|nr:MULTISPECIES: exonuclease SbcCD subunit D [unclassified Synechococcus]MEA5399711.1 exonuclease SbcCD subunit D [Synechococcus sp. BA-124 BA4]QPN56640.1 exonuclease SbcCD subunit D [Synechococcus sp. CBW1107]CAK6695522.1 Nuclease SbcCD subunit D [Synechococcus sp. CBW1107]
MRLLHTSDWHLGRSFHGASLLQEQAAALSRIVELARDGAVDAVLIAGDLYDRAIPPAEAVQLFNDTLAQLRHCGAAVVAIAGNHDSHVRVSVYDPLLASFGVTIRGDVRRAHEPVLVSSRLGGSPVAIYPLPYLEPAVDGPGLARALEQETEVVPPTRLRHDEVTRLALERIRRDLQQRPHHRSVLVAHTFVAGGESSESERELTVGNVDRVSVEAFAGFDYVALGHLHGSQQLDGPRMAYSGTPLPYSFSEQHHTKSVRIVELNAAGQLTVEIEPLEVGRSLATIEGSLEQLCRDAQFEAAVEAKVRVILTDEVLPLQAMARLRQRFPHVAELRHRPPELLRSSASERNRQVHRSVSPFDLTSAFFADQQGRSTTEAEADLLRQALEAAARGGEG